MSCAACQARVEKAASAVNGVETCSVNLLTGLMQAAGSFDTGAVIKAVEQAGYGAEINQSRILTEDNLSGGDSSRLLKRLISSAILLIILMYVSMGHMMWGLPLPAPLAGNYCILGIIQALLSLIIIIINRRFFINGAKGVLHLSPNMDTLVALGSGISYIYSLVLLINYICTSPHAFKTMDHFMDCPSLYFESAAMIVTLITVGKLLESVSKGRTTDAVKGLIKLSPMNTTLLRDGAELS
ncbi:MAG: heavy metal translocating P-type ATPase, partial [Parasporobacterium sp.]|nr:heavy metal translocating P-type ATPase [Parasporobacterium sp.]